MTAKVQPLATGDEPERSRHDFGKLWAGQTVSLVGSQVTVVALPLTAILVLGAGPADMGWLTAAGRLPSLAIGLFAGVVVDRVSRRRVLLLTNLGRAALLATIPVAAEVGALTLSQLYAVAFLTGVLAFLFEVAYAAYLPALVTRERLVAGNTRLEISRSLAQIAGPGLAGVLVQALTAPVAIAVDVASFVVAAVGLLTIRTEEPAPPALPRRSAMADLGEGLRHILGSPVQRSITACTGTYMVCSSVFTTVYLLYLVRQLEFDPLLLGAVLMAGAVGGLLGSLAAGPAARRLGLGRALIAGIVVSGLGGPLAVLAGGPRTLVVAVIGVAQFIVWVGLQVYNINSVSLRQAITPDHMQGRVTATIRFLIFGSTPVGALLGGLLGGAIGLRPTLALSGLGTLAAFLWLVASPVRGLRDPDAGGD